MVVIVVFAIIILAIIAQIIMLAVTYWYISVPIIAFIVFCLKADSIGKWRGQRRLQKQEAAARKEREEKAKILLKEREEKAKILLKEIRKRELEAKKRQAQKERKFWNDLKNKWEEQQIVQPALPDYTIKHKPKPHQTKKKSPKTLQDAMKQAFQAQIERKPVLDIKKCYKILGLTQEASVLQIQLRFKELALKYHPDRNLKNKSAAKKFAEVCEARQQILQLVQVVA